MTKINKILLIMISLRTLSSLVELSAAILMYYFKSVETAIRINAILGLFGPIILILVTFLGIIDISQQLSFEKILLIILGITLILIGTR